MSDQFDQAAKLEQQDRERSLATHKANQEKPLVINGQRYCLDCEIRVPKQRIEACNAVRCIECQTLNEIKHKQGRG